MASLNPAVQPRALDRAVSRWARSVGVSTGTPRSQLTWLADALLADRMPLYVYHVHRIRTFYRQELALLRR